MRPTMPFLLAGMMAILSGCISAKGLQDWRPVAGAESEWVEKHTGHRIVQLSLREGMNEVFYFHQNPFTDNGDQMVFMGSTPQGRNAFSVDLRTRAIRPITTVNTAFEVVAPQGRRLYYLSGDKVYATHLDTLETREIATAPHHYTFGRGFTVNSDETLLAGCYCLGEEQYYASNLPRNQWIQAIWEAKRPNAIYTINIQTGAVNEFYHEREWLGHVQFSPTDPTLLEFCHEGPGHDLDRTWMIRTDGSNLHRVYTKKFRHEFQTHEFWAPDGSGIWSDFQTPRFPSQYLPWLEAVMYPKFHLAFTDNNTQRTSRYAFPMRYASRHFNVSADQSLFCGDGEGGSFRLCRSGKWILLYTRDQGKLKVSKLCSMAGHAYKTYPEPNVHFTPDAKWVVFQSDATGTTQVYAVAVKK